MTDKICAFNDLSIPKEKYAFRLNKLSYPDKSSGIKQKSKNYIQKEYERQQSNIPNEKLKSHISPNSTTEINSINLNQNYPIFFSTNNNIINGKITGCHEITESINKNSLAQLNLEEIQQVERPKNCCPTIPSTSLESSKNKTAKISLLSYK